MELYNNLTELIGNTPLVKMGGIAPAGNIYGKMENMNPLCSVKDRLAIAMVEDAEKKGAIKKGSLLIEPTSGNTGIALAYIAAIRGYKLILTMSESMSIERRKILAALGAELILTPAEKGMTGAVNEAKDILSKNPGAVILDQFNNPANPEYHYRTTGKEILDDAGGKVDIFVAGVGTGGTITGVGRRLKEFNSNVKIVAVEPSDSPVLSGGKPGPHKIQGIGAGFIPGVLDIELIDEIITVNTDDAFGTSRKLMKTDGIFAGISSGANVWSALHLASRPENKGKTIVTIICDTAERYLSTLLF
ncbi:MAG: cysteine synthase A [Pseudomonadota bacterium]